MEAKIAKKARAHRPYHAVDGAVVPGVTTVLGVINKPQLVKWANNLGLAGIDSAAYVDETAKVGTLAHEMIQEYLGGPKWDRGAWDKDQIDLAENAVLSFFEWERQTGNKMKTIFIEKPLVSERMRVGGTIDWYGWMGDKLWLVDIKTSKALYPEHVFQVSAYAAMLEEWGYQVDGVRLLRVGRTEDEGFDDHIIGTAARKLGLRVFKAALELYRAKQAFEKHEKALSPKPARGKKTRQEAA
ncbi:MAG: hypothetical protein IJ705_08220 [Oscillospiraceae bacterium]|nr:hypothetical protein [Oscillospiraceae bacterium]